MLSYDDFEPTQLASFTFVADHGEASVPDEAFTGSTIGFGIAVGGVIVGAFIASLAAPEFRVRVATDANDVMHGT
ncbi:MAG: hypothetical protein H6891_02930 [Brucellaceae bacterium]|nr:hypothetical protein [Brucellaceae bacterium]